MGLLGGKKCDVAVQVFFKLFPDTQVGGGSIHLALKAIPNKEQQQWQQGGPNPVGEGRTAFTCVSSGGFITTVLLLYASPLLAFLCPQSGMAAGSFWKPSVSPCPWWLTSLWWDGDRGRVGDQCTVLSDTTQASWLVDLGRYGVLLGGACLLEAPMLHRRCCCWSPIPAKDPFSSSLGVYSNF